MSILVIASTILLAAGAGAILLIWHRGRPFAAGLVFRASRLSRGNHVFPTQVLITPTSVVHHTPQWIGHLEHSIHMAHIASVGIDTNLLFSDVYVETTGGASPIHCRGHRKSDAVRMKQEIEKHQSDYYRTSALAPSPGLSSGPRRADS